MIAVVSASAEKHSSTCLMLLPKATHLCSLTAQLRDFLGSKTPRPNYSHLQAEAGRADRHIGHPILLASPPFSMEPPDLVSFL